MTNSLPSQCSQRQFSQRTTTLALALPSASTMKQLVIAIQHIISTPFLTEMEAVEQVVTAVQCCAASNSAAMGGHHIDLLQCLSLLGLVSNRIPMPPAILAFARAAFGAPPLPSAAEPAFMAAPPPSFFPGVPSFPTLAYAPPSLLPPGVQVSHGASWPYVTVMVPQLLAQPTRATTATWCIPSLCGCGGSASSCSNGYWWPTSSSCPCHCSDDDGSASKLSCCSKPTPWPFHYHNKTRSSCSCHRAALGWCTLAPSITAPVAGGAFCSWPGMGPSQH